MFYAKLALFKEIATLMLCIILTNLIKGTRCDHTIFANNSGMLHMNMIIFNNESFRQKRKV